MREQIRIALGETLSWRQEDLVPRGHAIECRVYAEDPFRGFSPSPGRISFLREPGGPGVRVDSGVIEGDVVPLDYDPMLAKLIVWAPDRPAAAPRTGCPPMDSKPWSLTRLVSPGTNAVPDG